MTLGSGFVRLLAHRPSALVGALCLALVLLCAIIGPLLFPADPWAMNGLPLLWPGEDPAFPLGTDSMGRDLAAGIVSGAWVSLLIGLTSAAVSLLIGVGLGTLGGFYGGFVDTLAMRITEVFQTIPAIILAVVIAAMFQPTLLTIILSVGIVSWPATARMMRSQVKWVVAQDYILAARVVGMSDARLIFSHVLPNALPPVIALATLTVSNGILTAAALAFLGLGDPQVMDWGSIIGEGREQLLDAWYICALPGVAIMITVLGFNLLGEALNDNLNPRLRNR